MAIHTKEKAANEDLGLGAKVIEKNRTRFVNKDGSFNVYRKGVFDRGAYSPYHAALAMRWTRFYLWMFGIFLSINAIFAALYLMAGRDAFPPISDFPVGTRFLQLFLYSTQVLLPLGTSTLGPVSTFATIILALETMVGVLGFAIAAALIFARFSNPATRILFSEHAVVAPYQDITGFMFRIINGRSNELIEVSAAVTISMTEANGKRAFHRLALERDRISVFPLNWTIVHPITEESPLYGMTGEDFLQTGVEFVVNVSAIDQDLSKTVYTRTSYVADEVLFGVRFASILEESKEGAVVVDPAKISDVEEV
jgi:inward rectifier potassium channel